MQSFRYLVQSFVQSDLFGVVVLVVLIVKLFLHENAKIWPYIHDVITVIHT